MKTHVYESASLEAITLSYHLLDFRVTRQNTSVLVSNDLTYYFFLCRFRFSSDCTFHCSLPRKCYGKLTLAAASPNPFSSSHAGLIQHHGERSTCQGMLGGAVLSGFSPPPFFLFILERLKFHRIKRLQLCWGKNESRLSNLWTISH